MKAKRLTRRIARTTPVIATALLLALTHQGVVVAAPSVSSPSIASADQLDDLLASDLMVVGPVEAVDYRAAVAQVLGQSVQLGALDRKTLLQVVPGKVIAVRGQILGAGEIQAAALSIVASQYIAGAQPLFLRGVVSALQADIGMLAVGKLLIDYTGALYSLDPTSLEAGAEFVFSGIQATPNGSAFALSAAIRPKGITGSDLQSRGIAGSDVQATGITGSDLQSRGIAGSDVQATGITGSDVQAKGITGSDLQSRGITGSDVQATGITGSDLQSRGIAGSDLAGIAGSDF